MIDNGVDATGLLLAGQAHVLELIATGEPLPIVLDAIARLIEAQGDDVLCSILLMDPDGRRLRHGAAPGLPAAYNAAIDGLEIGPAVGSCGTAAFTRRPVIVADIQQDLKWVDFRDVAAAHGLRACWSTPIIGRADQVLGTFAMYYRDVRMPTDTDARLISMATYLTRIAVDHERHEQDRILRDVLTDAPVMIGLYRGPDHVLEFGNKMLMRTAGDREILGRPIRETSANLEDLSLLDKMDQAYASGQAYVGNEIVLRSKPTEGREAQTGYFNFVFQPVRAQNGSVEAILMHAVDVTQQVRARQHVESLAGELAAANRELEAFSYSVSHDLRAPLRAVDGFSRILLDEFAGDLPDTAQRYLRLVRDNAVQMGRLIDDLLAFSRLGRHELARRRVDMTALVNGVVRDLATELAGRAVDFQIEDLPPAHADGSLIRQVYVNLLGNAVKFTRERDPAIIHISSSKHGKRGVTVYSVRDNGVGFDMRYADKLFGVFQRLHRAEDYEGTGVGLAIVQRVVHRHGGRIWAESQPGQGAAFFFTLESAEQ